MKRAKTLSKVELKRVLAVVAAGRNAERNKIILYLSFYAGLRAKEIAELKVGDIFAKDGSVIQSVLLQAEQTKGERNRAFVINSTLARALSQYKERIDELEQNSPLIQSQKAGAFSANSMCQLMCTFYKEAGIYGASSHSGRRTFITTLANKGVSACILMELAGHRNLATTQRYIDVNDLLLQSAAELSIQQ